MQPRIVFVLANQIAEPQKTETAKHRNRKQRFIGTVHRTGIGGKTLANRKTSQFHHFPNCNKGHDAWVWKTVIIQMKGEIFIKSVQSQGLTDK